MQQILILGILTMCMSLLMISGDLDISIGNMTGLIAIIFARMLLAGVSIFAGVITTLVLGLFSGFTSGVIIAKSKVTSLIVFPGMSYVFPGIALTVGEGRPRAITGKFSSLGEAKMGEAVSVPIVIFFTISLFAFLLRKYTEYRRRFNAIGINSYV